MKLPPPQGEGREGDLSSRLHHLDQLPELRRTGIEAGRQHAPPGIEVDQLLLRLDQRLVLVEGGGGQREKPLALVLVDVGRTRATA